MSISKAAILLLFVLVSLSAYSQDIGRPKPPRTRVNTEDLADTTKTAKPNPPAIDDEDDEEEEPKPARIKDTTDYPFLTELHLLLDYGKLLTLPAPFESKAEGGIQAVFENRYVGSISYGYGSINPTGAYKNSDYNATGTYIKPGLFYQLAINPKNKLLLGAQYGMASFEDSGVTTIESASGLFEPYERAFARGGLKASWLELSIQSEGNFRGNFWLGFRASYRHLINMDNPGDPDVLIVPGYGKTVGSGVPAVNLFLKYKLNFFHPPVVVVPESED
ncbi:DUF6048 family protein [uncultured Imperialibacter sp.]|uniref:DUF6048 family protein n=1 Tax=uncultured Imperialibacter sp. TaxID=1672639 RepID=UPI0030DC3564|tara:strand:+ start:96140 stop:96970 length:831 start_codon:yes stop_codon:yes gene_type:complete